MGPTLHHHIVVCVLLLTTSGIGTQAADPELELRRCAANQPTCPESQAFCDGERCKCLSGIGNGHFVCHNELQEYCHIINDPVANTFGHEKFDLPLPCRFLAAHVSADNRYMNWIVSQCHTKVYAMNGRSRGKFFVSAFDVTVEYFSTSLHQLHFKVEGEVKGNEYEFELYLKNGVSDWLPFQTTFDLESIKSRLGGEVIFEVNDVTKSVRLYIETCALDVIFRPANGALGMHQVLMPGLSIAYDKNYDLEWWSVDDSVCLTPDLSVCSTGRVANDAELKPSEAFLWMALNTRTPQNMNLPTTTDQCPSVSDTIRECTNFRQHIEAMEMCTFILSYPLFVNCVSEKHGEFVTSNAVMRLFQECILAFCAKDIDMCTLVHDEIYEMSCDAHAYDAFINHGCQFQTEH